MNFIQKVGQQDTLFPFNFVYQDTKSPQRELSDHFHDYFEIVYVYKGKGTFFIGEGFHSMKQGDVFIIPNNTIHRAKPDQENPVTSTIIFFSPVLLYNHVGDESFSYHHLFKVIKETKQYQLSLSVETQKRMEERLQQIHQELAVDAPGAKHATMLIIHQIILELYRIKIQYQKLNYAKTDVADWMSDILAYINENVHKPLSLTELANKSLVSTAHFSRVFKQKIGMGLVEYLHIKRIIMAKELLVSTSYTIDQITEKCGIESTSHFHRLFKKYVKMTPSSYRKHATTKAHM